jgi:hypothetical protein
LAWYELLRSGREPENRSVVLESILWFHHAVKIQNKVLKMDDDWVKKGVIRIKDIAVETGKLAVDRITTRIVNKA